MGVRMPLEWRSLLFGPYENGVFDDGAIRIMSPRPFYIGNSHLRDPQGKPIIVPCINPQPGPGRIQMRFYEPVATFMVKATCKSMGVPCLQGYYENNSGPGDPGRLLEAPEYDELSITSWPKGSANIVEVHLFVKNEDGQERLNDGLWGLPEWSVGTP